MEPVRAKARGTQGRNTKAALIPALKGGVCERRSIKETNEQIENRKAKYPVLAVLDFYAITVFIVSFC